ncbi:MAG: ATP-binding protein, partial [Candidatus Omnitrophica bacterium]|nr:ATP-binding protein [Candidatus Omnitrophota bacterium]
MKFYDRQQELSELNKLLEQTRRGARMTVLTGRRRVGKTLLSLEFAKHQKYLYFFVAKKSENLLCAEYLQDIKSSFPDTPVIGKIHSFKDVFQLLLQMAQKERFVLIIDEFQEFYNINPAIYSEIQKLWDLNKKQSSLNVIFIGSVYS